MYVSAASLSLTGGAWFQVEMWERITAGVATLEPSAQNLEATMSEEELVEYEGMLVAASAAQRRR